MKMERLKRLRARAKTAITRIESFIVSAETKPNIDINEYSIRETHLAKAYEDYVSAQNEIEDEDETQVDDRIEVENKYFLLAAKIKTVLQTKLSQNNSTDAENSNGQSIVPNNPFSSNPQKQVYLPQVSLPTFSGRYDEWKTFSDLFTALVDKNEQITDAQKFLYLKTNLKNEPLTLINDLALTNENYTVALDILKKRYDNKLVIINSHLKGLLELENITNETASNLRHFLSQIRQHLNSLRSLKVPVDQWDLMLIYLFCKKLNSRTHQAFELQKKQSQLPTLEEFLEFLENRCLALENVSSSDVKVKPRVTNFVKSSDPHSSSPKRKCLFCKLENHSLYRCTKFKEISHREKHQFVQKNKLCFNCFGTLHNVSQCTSKGCRVCSKKHHTLLHKNGSPSRNDSHQISSTNSQNQTTVPSSNSVNSQTSNAPSEAGASQSVLVTHGNYSQILLATAKLTLVSQSGVKVSARALLDSASQTSFITLDLYKRLNSDGYRKIINIQGISDSVTQTDRMIDVQIQSHVDKTFKMDASCAVLNKITCPLPHSVVEAQTLQIPRDFKLADPLFHTPSKVDMLIGADLYFDLIAPGLLSLGQNLPTLQNSYLGWIIAGPIPQSCYTNLSLSLFTHSQNIEELIPKFWQLEELSSKRFLSPEDKHCEEKFINSVKRTESGNFQVDLPLRDDNDFETLGDSFSSASRRFFSLEKRLLNNKELFAQYKQFIDEYVELGHARYVPLDAERKHFLPHHCVLRESSSTTKLRVVFDASMKTSSGISLNDIMLKGFPVQPELFDILCRFRLHKYVLTADIVKMYRQVRINPSQHFLQNILWRENPSEPLKCIQLQTVTYGTNSAPFLATRCLVHLAEQNSTTYPLASQTILTQCYVDDILAGADSVDEGLQLVNQLTEMLKSAGFELHKWCSNHISILQNIPSEKRALELSINDSHSSKVLGISWNPHSDTFHIATPSFTPEGAFTKRQVLSCIATMFDPLGLIGPVVVVAKMLMQQIWISKINWDDQLPSELEKKWKDFSQNISNLSSLSIPRWILGPSPIHAIQLHGFADASLRGYGAALYLRILYTDHSISSNLLCSRSRVAPLKTISLPRLELCGVVLLARLLHRITSIFSHKIDHTFLWTDSQIVLCWLKSHPSRWTTFVANRVSEVQELTTSCLWNHIRSSDNPADFLSRGIDSTEISSNELWWHGPQMLQDFDAQFDSQVSDPLSDSVPEQRKVALPTTLTSDPTRFILNFSTFLRLQKSFAYCLRFIKNSKPGSQKLSGSLSVEETKSSLLTLAKIVQSQYFSQEISQLKSGNPISDSSIISLNPFIDENDILRVGGRLTYADVSVDQKHPILLPSKTHFTRLLLQHEHVKLHHAGAQTVLANIRLRFWPINGLREIKSIIKGCVTCHRFKANASQQIMGSLPLDRVSVTRPFRKVGVDFGGPLFIKQSKLRRASTTKCYIAFFVCLATKAVHIELVSSLSTESFLLTLKRFIARRGQPTTIFSDNGTNFHGAHNQLKDLYHFFKSKSNLDSIQAFLISREIEWKFIPPNSPHWGGLWEAGIKATKYHIRRVVGNSNLTFEELATVLAQIEAILNSRPLCPLSNDPSDMTCLTPAHFLIGEPLTSYPEKDISHVPENKLSFWQRCSKMQQHFWKRWSVEYLNRLQNRPKWFKPHPNLKENMVVLIKEDNVPPLQWPLARVVQTMPGRDNKVRVVKVKTKNGVFVRPISKLCPLPQACWSETPTEGGGC